MEENMGQTLVEKILSENVGRSVKAGETVVVDVNFAALHDGSGPLLVRLMKERGYDKDPVFDPRKVLFATSSALSRRAKLQTSTRCAANTRILIIASGKREPRGTFTLTCMNRT